MIETLWLVCPALGALCGALYGVRRYRRLRAQALAEGRQAAAQGPLARGQWEAVMRQRGEAEREARRAL